MVPAEAGSFVQAHGASPSEVLRICQGNNGQILEVLSKEVTSFSLHF